MSSTTYDRSKVLDSIDNWTLEKACRIWAAIDYPSEMKGRFIALVKHQCYPGGGKVGQYSVHQAVVYPDDYTHCWRCKERIPDKMVVLWRFMNHDALQYRKRNLVGYNVGGKSSVANLQRVGRGLRKARGSEV
jgi:hypothetical protein